MATTDNFYYAEGNASVKDIVKNIIKEITQKSEIYKWNLVFPQETDKIKDYAIVSSKNLYCDKAFYTKFERTVATTPTSDEQKLLDKYESSKPYTDEQINLLKKYIGSLDLGRFISQETNLIKKDSTTLTEDEQDLLQFIVTVRAMQQIEIDLAKKYLKGESMSTDEQNQYQTLKESHQLTSDDLLKLQKLKANKKIYSDHIISIILKQAMGRALTSSEQSSLASYRQSLELTDAELQKIAVLKGKMDNRNHIEITIGTDIEDKQIVIDGAQQTIKDLVDGECSLPARFSWYMNLDKTIGEWLPVEYWLTQNKDSLNIVLRGDKSADVYPYKNQLTSWAYIGAVKPVEDSAYTDDKYNWGICTSSDLEPQYIPKFGPRTGTGITDFVMVGNKIGMPYQPHYPSHYTTNPFMDKCNTEGSRWNVKKRTFDDITITHPIDMERGKLQNVMVGDASSIYDNDKLIYKKDTPEAEQYKKFKINAPYNLLTNGPNVLYAIAIRVPLKTD